MHAEAAGKKKKRCGEKSNFLFPRAMHRSTAGGSSIGTFIFHLGLLQIAQ